uniref:Fe2OG dioxygenase domain-containing protein n=1 Tax=Psilocybe cubensis TaxID=181762 RepID=A0A8H7XPF6_PSICU
MSAPGTLERLPIIDIAPLLNDDPANSGKRAETAAALHAACVDYGFFYLDIRAYVDPAEPEELARLAKQFFDLPPEVKDQLSLRNQDNARGYARLNQNVTNGKADNHEGLDFYKPVEHPDKTKPVWGENQWPTSIPDFRTKYEAWVEKMKTLGLILMEAMSMGLGMTSQEWQDLRSQVDDSFWVMRVIGYPPLPNDHEGFSCGAHKDYGCLTFLYADPTPSALQVFLRRPNSIDQSKDGLPSEQGEEEGVWINADPIPGCVVCNIGEMAIPVWEIWTDGLYRSTLHRVVHRGSNFRVSIPFFFEPNFDALIKSLPVMERIRSEGGPVAAKAQLTSKMSVVYGDFLVRKVGNNFAADGKGKYD